MLAGEVGLRGTAWKRSPIRLAGVRLCGAAGGRAARGRAKARPCIRPSVRRSLQAGVGQAIRGRLHGCPFHGVSGAPAAFHIFDLPRPRPRPRRTRDGFLRGIERDFEDLIELGAEVDLLAVLQHAVSED